MTDWPERAVVLRSERDGRGSRHLSAAFGPTGNFVFSGQDLGSGVEGFFGAGNREYEWAWTVLTADVPRLKAALDVTDDEALLDAVARRFSGPGAMGARGFLDGAGVPYRVWSRVGD